MLIRVPVEYPVSTPSSARRVPVECPEYPEYPEYPPSLPPAVRLAAQGALFVKLLVHKCHVNKLNLYNQVRARGKEYPEYSGYPPGGGVSTPSRGYSGYSRASARPGAVT